MLQQRPNFLTNEYYNPQKLRLKKIKIDKIFTTKIFHNMKKLHKILFLGEKGGGEAIFRGIFFLGGKYTRGTFPVAAFFRGTFFPRAFFLAPKT